MQPDFSHLYNAIGVRPDCSLEAFRQAFRRHVASRHPDRADGAAPVGDAPQPLSEINALYEMAMRFHGRHGRLPGAALSVASAGTRMQADDVEPARGGEPRRDAPSRPASADRAPRESASEPPSTGARRWVLWLVVAALLVVAIGFWQSPSHSQRAVAADAAAHPEAQPDALPTQLALGMSADTVRAIQGEPLRMRDGEWDYGPSWLRFEHGRLVDWYSSPLNRLKTATASPQDAAAGTPDDAASAPL